MLDSQLKYASHVQSLNIYRSNPLLLRPHVLVTKRHISERDKTHANDHNGITPSLRTLTRPLMSHRCANGTADNKTTTGRPYESWLSVLQSSSFDALFVKGWIHSDARRWSKRLCVPCPSGGYALHSKTRNFPKKQQSNNVESRGLSYMYMVYKLWYNYFGSQVASYPPDRRPLGLLRTFFGSRSQSPSPECDFALPSGPRR